MEFQEGKICKNKENYSSVCEFTTYLVDDRGIRYQTLGREDHCWCEKTIRPLKRILLAKW